MKQTFRNLFEFLRRIVYWRQGTKHLKGKSIIDSRDDESYSPYGTAVVVTVITNEFNAYSAFIW